LDVRTVKKVARIARLRLTEEEIAQYAEDMDDVLNYFAILDEAPDLGRHDFNPVPVSDVLREDEPSLDISPEELRAMMDTYQEMVRGPRL